MMYNYFFRVLLGFLVAGFSCGIVTAENYAQRPEVIEFVDELVQQHGLNREQLLATFAATEPSAEVITRISTPYEALPWNKYRPIFVNEKKISGGVNFWQQHTKSLNRAEKEFGVPAAVIVAIIGIESAYGQNHGKYPVIQALSTLAFDYAPRAKFFRNELKEYLLLVQEQHLDLLNLRGSYAGAIGMPQFIPSSYRRYAVDFDGSGRIDLSNNVVQVIGSVANYFKVHGWQSGHQVAVKAAVDEKLLPGLQLENKNDPKPTLSLRTLKQHGITPSKKIKDTDAALALLEFQDEKSPEYWLGLNNFYVITRYNHSNNYALAAFQLSQDINSAYRKAPTR
jgi:membrane-bound lytic murein transglycosylase B